MATMKNTLCFICCAAIALIVLENCKSKKQEKPLPLPVLKKEKDTATKAAPVKGPIINLLDTTETRRIIVCIKDSAATSAGMSIKLNNIYNKKLSAFIKSNKLKVTGAPVAWYKTQKAPYFFEAGLPVDKAPVKQVKGIFVKRTGGDSAIIAHFFGPYDLTNAAYEALADFIKSNKKIRTALPYEMYINNPFDSTLTKKTDPYKMQTDIVFPYKSK